MAYNAFPAGYQPAYYPQSYNAPQQSNGIIWVQGEGGAKSYLVAPNCTVQLWDSEKQVIYLKSADATGMPSMKTLDYTIREQAPMASPVGVDYATKADVAALAEQLKALRAEVEGGKDE